MRTTIRITISVIFCFITSCLVIKAQNMECPCIADTMFSGHSSEHNTNCGARTNLRVKGWQGIAVFRFDIAKLEGGKIDSATLKVYCSAITGTGKSPLTLIDMKISTMAHDWIEGDGDYTPTDKFSTYDSPGADIGKWAEKDHDGNGRNGVQINVEDAINGVGDSVLNQEIPEITFTVSEWTEIPLDPETIQALVDSNQYGIAVWQPDIGINLDIASREANGGGNSAVLLVSARNIAVDRRCRLTTEWGRVKGNKGI